MKFLLMIRSNESYLFKLKLPIASEFSISKLDYQLKCALIIGLKHVIKWAAKMGFSDRISQVKERSLVVSEW